MTGTLNPYLLVSALLLIAGSLTAVVLWRRLSQARADLQRRERDIEGLLAKADEERRRFAEENRRLGDALLTTVSRQLRESIHTLIGWIHLLRSGQLSANQQGRALDAMEQSARLQAKVIADLLDASGAASGELRLDLEEVPVPPLVEGVLHSMRPIVEARHLRLHTRIDAEAPLLVDPARLQQILINLMANAISFTPGNGTIAVDVCADQHDLTIRVSDTGAGIAPAFLPHVFDRFRQEHAPAAGSPGGVGLGLSIVKDLAELHGGSVRAESAGPERGSTFTVRLPARRRPAPPPAAPVRH